MSIVATNVAYNYDVLLNNMYALKRAYPFLYIDSIGESVLR